MKSKKKLFADLGELGYDEMSRRGLYSNSVGNETFGKKSCIYLDFESKEETDKVKRQLKARGHKIDSYGIDTTIQVQVTYFKGFHWDE